MKTKISISYFNCSHTKVSKLYFYKYAHFLLFLSLSTVLIHQFHLSTKIFTLILLTPTPNSPHSHPYSPHYYPDSRHSHPNSSHSYYSHPDSPHFHPQFPAFLPWFPSFPPWFPAFPSFPPWFPAFPPWFSVFPSFPSYRFPIPHSGFYR